MFRRYVKPFLLVAGAMLAITSCKNSNSWLARQYKNTVSHYNIFFNAEQQYNEVLSTMLESNVDDYRRVIPILNLGDLSFLKNNQPAMDEVIKRTSTLIDKYPKSRWVDDAYLLNGKAYLLKGDLYAARDLFDYTASTSKDPRIIYEAKLLFARSLLLQPDKLEEAESFLLSLKEEKNFPKKDKFITLLYNQTLADAYAAQEKYKEALGPLKKATLGMKGRLTKYRTYFATAQVCMNLEKFNDAQYFFQKCIKLNPPYEMAFNSNIALVQILSLQQKNYAKANKLLKRMLKDDKNIDYYGKIYYEIAKNEMAAKNISSAINFFNKSIAESKIKNDNQQITTSYLALADYYFDKKNYLAAGNYYDSASNTMDEKYPNFAEISKRNEKLKVLVENIIQIQLQDSLIKMAKDPIFREKSIDNAIELEKIAAQKQQQQQQQKNTNINSLGSLNTKSTLPFYNPQLRKQGFDEFKRKWGNRPNADNWRYNSRLKKQKDDGNTNNGSSNNTTTTDTNQVLDPILASAAPERRVYLEKVPFTSKKQNQAFEILEESYFAVGMQYANALDQPENAIKYFEEMLKRFPATKSKPQVYYELIKLYTKTGNSTKSDFYKQLLEKEFPESNYLKILQVGEDGQTTAVATATKEQKEVQTLYENMYAQYLSKNYTTALETKANADAKFLGNALQPKFDYVQALCLIKIGRKEDAFKILENILTDYPKTDIAELAQNLIDAKAQLDNPVTITTSDANEEWAVSAPTDELMYLLMFDKKNNSNMIRAALTDYCKKDYVLEELEISNAQVSGTQVYIYISGFSDAQVAKDFYGRLKNNPALYNSKGLYEFSHAYISSTNLKTLNKNLQFSSYFNFFNKIN